MILCLGTTPALQRVMVFPRLTPNAVNRALTTADGPAGKAVNAAKVLRALGEHPVLTGFLGGHRGQQLRTSLAAQNIDLDFVTVAAPTRLCITLLDNAAATCTELVEEGHPVTPADYDELLRVVRRRLPNCRALLMSGTVPAGGPPDLYRQCAQLAHDTGSLCIVDAQGLPLREALKAKPALVKPNRTELAATLDRQLPDDNAVMAAMRDLGHLGAQRIVVTAGHQPTLAFDGHTFWKIQPPPITPLNPIGSGDAFAAALLWRLLRGEPLGEACRWAAAAGAANALTLMPGDLQPHDLRRLALQVTVQPLT